MRSLPLLIAMVLLVAACSDGGLASVDQPSSTTTGSDARDGGEGDRAQPAGVGGSADYDGIDYDAESVGSALRSDRYDERFPAPVVDPADIVSGGPPPDGIPPIDQPVFIGVDEVDFLDSEEEAVVVVEVNGDARAYPIQILIWHEIVNDEVGGVPVTVTYCPLCNSAVVYERQLGDRLLDFGTSGELYQSALVMYDRQTESLWAHFTGQGIVGHYAGAQLQLVPAQTLGFAAFETAFPDGRVLAPVTGFERPYGSNPYVGYDDAGTSPIGGFISQPIDDTYRPKARVLGVTDELGAFSVLLDDLAAARVVAVDEGGRNLVAFHTPGLNSSIDDQRVGGGRDVGQTGVFRAETSDGTTLTFIADGDHFGDNETGSTWDILGRSIGGPLAGERLEAVPHVDSFWFAWSTYQPDQVLIEP